MRTFKSIFGAAALAAVVALGGCSSGAEEEAGLGFPLPSPTDAAITESNARGTAVLVLALSSSLLELGLNGVIEVDALQSGPTSVRIDEFGTVTATNYTVRAEESLEGTAYTFEFDGLVAGVLDHPLIVRTVVPVFGRINNDLIGNPNLGQITITDNKGGVITVTAVNPEKVRIDWSTSSWEVPWASFLD
jgi:hypothetical protein